MNRIRLFTIPIVCCSLFSFNLAMAQSTQTSKIDRLEKLLKSDVKEKDTKYVTGYILDSLVIQNQKILSGSQLEAGKSFGSSISITDKGATVNVSLPKIRRVKWLYSQVQVSGAGKDNFISLFKYGQYGNTISGGLNFNFFGNSYGTYSKANKRNLRYQLDVLDADYKNYEPGKGRTAFKDELKYYQDRINELSNGVQAFFDSEDETKDLNTEQKKKLFEFLKVTDTLAKVGLLPKNFLKAKDAAEMNKMIIELQNSWKSNGNSEGQGLVTYREKLYLQKAEALQMASKWNSMNFFWFSTAANLNVSPYNILDISAMDNNYTRVSNDYFFSGSISWSWLNSRMNGAQFKFFISPTLRYQNARQFNPKDKMTLERNKPYVIGADSLVHRAMTTDVFPDVATRKDAWAFELPTILYWNKHNFGIELTPKAGVNDINGDNYGFKFGVFIPVQIKEGVPLIVQPIFRLQKLFEDQEAEFWKDNVVVGFNVSVSLPKGLGKIGNSKK